MDFSQSHVWMPHRVSYGETDAMGVLYYAEYLHIFERARSFYSRACACSYNEVEKKVSFCRYARPSAGIARRRIMMI